MQRLEKYSCRERYSSPEKNHKRPSQRTRHSNFRKAKSGNGGNGHSSLS